jgi:hypothetical protein
MSAYTAALVRPVNRGSIAGGRMIKGTTRVGEAVPPVRLQSSAMMGLRRTPIPVISTSIVSPGFIHSGGV